MAEKKIDLNELLKMEMDKIILKDELLNFLSRYANKYPQFQSEASIYELKESLILYHGSYCEVSRPDLRKCAKMKDFGQGFYLISSKEQAESFFEII